MDSRDLMKEARRLALMHGQRAVIIIGMDDTGIVVQGWSPTGVEQRVTDVLTHVALDAIMESMRKAHADKGVLKVVE